LSAPRPDLIVIGGGSAGLEVARIASRAGRKVTLLEEGVGKGRNFLQLVPLLVGKIIANPKFANHATTTPQKGLDHRQLPVILGRGLGGSSRINGNVAECGPSVRYEASFPFWPKNMIAQILAGLDRSGPCTITRQDSWSDALSGLFIASAGAVFPKSQGFFAPKVLGVHTKSGLRFNHFDGYRLTAIHKNISLIQGARAVKLTFDKRKIISVIYEKAGQRHEICADEIVVSAGVVQSPLLLMYSGIGEPDVLKQANITCLHPLRAVGQHVKDHPNMRIPFATPGHNTLNQKTRGAAALIEGLKFIFGAKNTVLRGPGASAGVNVALDDLAHDAAIRLQLVHFTQDRSVISHKGIQFEKTQKASIGFAPLWPSSEGSITLDANGHALIDPGFLTNPQDLMVAKAGLAAAYQLIMAMGFQPDQLLPEESQESFLRSTAYSGYHLLGSNRMALTPDLGVVGPDFETFGLKGLYIVDASVMPDHLSSHSYLPTISMARFFAHKKGWESAI